MYRLSTLFASFNLWLVAFLFHVISKIVIALPCDVHPAYPLLFPGFTNLQKETLRLNIDLFDYFQLIEEEKEIVIY